MATKNAKITSRNIEQKGQKPYFTDYTLAGTPCGETKAKLLRSAYDKERRAIERNRYFRDAYHTNPMKSEPMPRFGYPTKRVRDDDIPSHRKVPYSNFLNRFKQVEKTTFGLTGIMIAHSIKVWILHATRGWKISHLH